MDVRIKLKSITLKLHHHWLHDLTKIVFDQSLITKLHEFSSTSDDTSTLCIGVFAV